MVPTFPEGSPGPGTSLDTARHDADQKRDAYALLAVCRPNLITQEKEICGALGKP